MRDPLVRVAAALFLVPALAVSGCGGGGGGGGGDAPLTLVEFLFVNEALVPSFPTGTQSLPRNARLVLKFSDRVNPNSVHEQTIRIRTEPNFQTVPEGSFQVDGDRVIFDPTITASGQPNPSGFDAFAAYSVTLPSVSERETDPLTAVVSSVEGAPLLTAFSTAFKTGGGFLRDSRPPSVVEVFFLPTPDPLTKQIPGNGLLALRFDEPMDPASFLLSTTTPAAAPEDTVDVRYDCLDTVNVANHVECRPIAMRNPVPDPSMRTWFLEPVFSFGTRKYKFHVSLAQGLRDLAGNPLSNPRSFGPFVVDGTGSEEGDVLLETFANQIDDDTAATSADWGQTEQGALLGAAITTRRAFVTGWQAADGASPDVGQYVRLVDPLVGVDLNVPVPVVPSTELGRRVLWSFADTEIGEDGTVTAISWGPDGNSTFAARYPEIVMRMGFQRNASMNLAGTFSGNYLGTALVIYRGEYVVAQQANVGDEAAATPPAPAPHSQLDPLYDANGDAVLGVGFTNWPAPTSYFDWDEGDPAVAGDRVLLFDVSAQEGDSHNRFRGWFGWKSPGSTSLIDGYPQRRLRGLYEGDTANPSPNPASAVYNPAPTVQDMAFTLTKRVSVAQSRFYTPGPSDADGNLYPAPYSTQRTRGTHSDYRPPVLLPAVQVGGATVSIEFQGAMSLETGSGRTSINLAQAFTAWTGDVDDVDGFPYVRWRLRLGANLASSTLPRVSSVMLPLVSLP
jgi:hypothetical protein